MKKGPTTAIILLVSAMAVYLTGCGDKFFDPAQVGRFRPVPAVNVILDSLGVAEETSSEWEGAEDPKPVDVIPHEVDYVFGSGDTVRIAIFELQQEGVMFINDYIVTESGNISIPEIGVVEAVGLTESQLEEELKRILSPSILKEPSVSVALMSSQQHTFSILGSGIPSPSRYLIPRYDYRLTDALATAGGISEFNTSYIYVTRPVTGKEAIAEPTAPAAAEANEAVTPEQNMLEIIAPRAQRQAPNSGLVITSSEMVTDRELAEIAVPEGFELFTDEGQSAAGIEELPAALNRPARQDTRSEPINLQEVEEIEWVFQDGKWVPVPVGRPISAKPPAKIEPTKKIPAVPELKEQLPEKFEWDLMQASEMQMRVIKIPADKLRGGDYRYNIIIRPGDTIYVPLDIIGEYYIMGNTNYQGYINLTGRPMTLKMAIAAAGGLGPLAWPKSCEVIRRLSRKKEEIVMVDLDKIFSGEQPDFFIRPNDVVNVGTHPTAMWRAVLRNAFRATYGFGFVYDRNFSDRAFGLRNPLGPFNVRPFNYGFLEDIVPKGVFNN
jgi:protein involved in polysaccharide export with SLBB domain